MVAVLAYEGYNIEDALVMNRGSIQRGLARSHFFRVLEAEERKYPAARRTVRDPDVEVRGAEGAKPTTSSIQTAWSTPMPMWAPMTS